MRLDQLIVFETKTKFYIVGRVNFSKSYRILKIEKQPAAATGSIPASYQPPELDITEDQTLYAESDLRNLLIMIDNGNKSSGGLKKIVDACGIVGFVRFSECHYLYLITKAKQVAVIAGHLLYGIESTRLIPLNGGRISEKSLEEQRYVDVFLGVDLTKNFYFSYTYDLTNTMQWNMHESQSTDFQEMMLWNYYLLHNGFQRIDKQESPWVLPIIHGFIQQSRISLHGRSISITLIARRSRHFAGARFLKRGVNDRGCVANEVETEQIVCDESTATTVSASSSNTMCSSFVQHRGSIPLYWSQEVSNMSPKPPIQINFNDPFYTAAALHFNSLFKRYGAPVIVLNLVKHKEVTRRESILLDEYTQTVTYLNQFLPAENRIKYIAFDMARAAKSHDQDVIALLETITSEFLKKVGFFHAGPEPFMGAYQRQKLHSAHHDGKISDGDYRRDWKIQSGVVRTNCIDCLDRTNAAQFMLGRCALGHQLHALGLIPTPAVPIDCEAVKLLTQMYHDHGDIIAFQYGGSALVNTMETYRKQNAWTSQSRDMIESVRRYYSNSFTDTEKQQSINLFLGNYVSHRGRPTLWELDNDFYLHHQDPRFKKPQTSYTAWFNKDYLDMAQRLAGARRKPLAEFAISHPSHELTAFQSNFFCARQIDTSLSSDSGYVGPFGVLAENSINRLAMLGFNFMEDIENVSVDEDDEESDFGGDDDYNFYNFTDQLLAARQRIQPFTADSAETAVQTSRPFVLPVEQEEYRRYLSQFTVNGSGGGGGGEPEGHDYGETFYSQYLHQFQNPDVTQFTELTVDLKNCRLYEESCDVLGIMTRPASSAMYEGYRRWKGVL